MSGIDNDSQLNDTQKQVASAARAEAAATNEEQPKA